MCHAGAEATARAPEALQDPGSVRRCCESRVAVLELQRHRFEARGAHAVQRDEEEQAEVVAERAMGRIVVDEVAEVVEDRPLDAVRDVGRVAGDKRGAGLAQPGRGA